MTKLDAAPGALPGWTAGWWLCGGWVVCGGLVCGACAGTSDEHIQPGPSLSDGGGSGAARGGTSPVTGGSQAAGGSDTAGDGGAGAKACPAYAPDRCPDASEKNGAACVTFDSDPENCGNCGATCPPQAACAAGKCGPVPQELAKGKACGNVRLALQAAGGDPELFWTEQQSGRVRALPLTARAVTVEVASAESSPNRISVDAGGLYWVNAGDGSSGSSQVMWQSFSHGAAPVALVTAPGTEPLVGVAVADGRLFYGLGHDIHAIAADGSDSADVVVGVSFARNDTRMPDGTPEALTVHDGRVYWIVTTVGSVESDDLLEGSDGTPRVGHSGQLWPNDLGFSGDYVYYAAFASLYAAQADMPALAVASSADDASVAAFAVNATDGYFADQGGRLSKHGLALPAGPDFQPTPSVLLARDQGNITSVVLDDGNVYWASVDPASGDCAIRKLPL